MSCQLLLIKIWWSNGDEISIFKLLLIIGTFLLNLLTLSHSSWFSRKDNEPVGSHVIFRRSSKTLEPERMHENGTNLTMASVRDLTTTCSYPDSSCTAPKTSLTSILRETLSQCGHKFNLQPSFTIHNFHKYYFHGTYRIITFFCFLSGSDCIFCVQVIEKEFNWERVELLDVW